MIESEIFFKKLFKTTLTNTFNFNKKTKLFCVFHRSVCTNIECVKTADQLCLETKRRHLRHIKKDIMC